MACWLGIDLGTTSVKVVLIDKCGHVVASFSRQAEANVDSNVGDIGFEQDPAKILTVAKDLINMVAKQHKIGGIGVTGQMHGVVLWGKGERTAGEEHPGQSCYHSNLYTWQDRRCTPEFIASLPRPRSDPQDTPSTGYGCATLFWLHRYQPAFISSSKFSACGTVMDYLTCRLCNLDHPVTSPQLAASFGYFDKDTGSWDRALSQSENFTFGLLPTMAAAGSVAGHTDGSMGLPEGIPVLVAMGDVQCAMHAVITSPLEAAVNISTSIQLGFLVPEEKKEAVSGLSPPCVSFLPYFGGQQLALFAGLNGGNVIQCFAESISEWMKDLGISEDVEPSSLLPKLQKLSDDTPKGRGLTASYPADYPVVKPALFGERYDKNLQASVSGLNFSNLRSVGLVFRGLSEGIVDHLHEMVPAEYLLGLGIQALRVCGSVPSTNSAVRNRLKVLYTFGGDGEVNDRGSDHSHVEKSDLQSDTSSENIGLADGGRGDYYYSEKTDLGEGRRGELFKTDGNICGKVHSQMSYNKETCGRVKGRQLVVEMDSTGLEAISSALGAAMIAKQFCGPDGGTLP